MLNGLHIVAFLSLSHGTQGNKCTKETSTQLSLFLPLTKLFFFLSFFKAPEKEEKKAVELNRPFPKLSSTSDVQVSPL